MLRQITIILFLFLGFSVFAQSYNYIHYTPNDGLLSSEVYHVFQDSKGYIWFATDNGVSRFDGYEFKNFTVEDGLLNNTIFEIYEDYIGRIWFLGLHAKLSYFQKDSIHQFKYNHLLIDSTGLPPIPLKKTFYIDSLGTIYYCDKSKGIKCISIKGEVHDIEKKINLIKINNHILINQTTTTEETLTIFYNNKFGKLDINLTEIPDHGYYRMAVTFQNKILYTASNRLYIISDSSKIKTYDFPNQIIWLSSHEDKIWIGTSSGIYLIKIKKNNEILILTHLLKDLTVSSVLVDNENGIWLTTLSNSVFYIPDFGIKTLTKENSSLTSNVVTKLANDSSQIWCGLDDGYLLYYDNNLHKSIKLHRNNRNLPITDINITNKLVYAANSEKTIWFKSSTPQEFNSSNYINRGANSLFNNSDSTLLLANERGIEKIVNKEIRNRYSKSEKGSFIAYCIVKLSKQEYLVGTNIGLLKFNESTLKFNDLSYLHENLTDRINIIQISNIDSSIFIGTKTKGLVILRKDSTFCINTANGIDNNNITSLFQHKNNLWIGTKGGGAYKLTFYNEKQNTFELERVNVFHGLLSNEINDIVANDTAVFLATYGGINIINYVDYKYNLNPPPIYVKNIKINGKDTIVKKEYILDYNENSFEIELLGISFKQKGNVKYKYRLSSKNPLTSWNTTTNHNITLSFIPPGNYTFQAKAINENNIESERPVEIEVRIKPPYWKTLWFKILGIILIILFTSLILYAFYRIRIREIEKRNQLEKEFIENKNLLQQEIEKFRQQALSQQMNPHFIFNSLNSIQYFIYQNEKALSNKYLTKFSRLIRIILENSQHQTIPLKDEFEALQLYLELEEMRLQGKLKFTIEIDKSINLEFYTIPPLLIQPFAENAIWHGIVNKKDKGKVTIKLTENTDHFICIIEDDGVGREKAKEIQARKQKLHKSLGASITERRLALLNSTYGEKNTISYTDLTNDGVATGTKVEIKIPKQSSREIKTS